MPYTAALQGLVPIAQPCHTSSQQRFIKARANASRQPAPDAAYAAALATAGCRRRGAIRIKVEQPNSAPPGSWAFYEQIKYLPFCQDDLNRLRRTYLIEDFKRQKAARSTRSGQLYNISYDEKRVCKLKWFQPSAWAKVTAGGMDPEAVQFPPEQLLHILRSLEQYDLCCHINPELPPALRGGDQEGVAVVEFVDLTQDDPEQIDISTYICCSVSTQGVKAEPMDEVEEPGSGGAGAAEGGREDSDGSAGEGWEGMTEDESDEGEEEEGQVQRWEEEARLATDEEEEDDRLFAQMEEESERVAQEETDRDNECHEPLLSWKDEDLQHEAAEEQEAQEQQRRQGQPQQHWLRCPLQLQQAVQAAIRPRREFALIVRGLLCCFKADIRVTPAALSLLQEVTEVFCCTRSFSLEPSMLEPADDWRTGRHACFSVSWLVRGSSRQLSTQSTQPCTVRTGLQNAVEYVANCFLEHLLRDALTVTEYQQYLTLHVDHVEQAVRIYEEDRNRSLPWWAPGHPAWPPFSLKTLECSEVIEGPVMQYHVAMGCHGRWTTDIPPCTSWMSYPPKD